MVPQTDDPRTSGDPRHYGWTNMQQKWLEMTCVIVDEYQCHACRAVSIQLHLTPVTSLAVKRLQWVAGRGAGGAQMMHRLDTGGRGAHSVT